MCGPSTLYLGFTLQGIMLSPKGNLVSSCSPGAGCDLQGSVVCLMGAGWECIHHHAPKVLQGHVGRRILSRMVIQRLLGFLCPGSLGSLERQPA